jgi:DNA repair photolyase
VENAAARLRLRWKSTRGDLQERGVPVGVLEAVDPLVEGGTRAAVEAFLRRSAEAGSDEETRSESPAGGSPERA